LHRPQALDFGPALDQNLRTVDLSSKEFGDFEAIVLAGSVTGNSRVSSMDISGNNLGLRALKVLGKVVATNSLGQLGTIIASGNEFGNGAGGRVIATVLRCNTTLCALDLSGNANFAKAAPIDFVQEMAVGLRCNSTLTSLSLCHMNLRMRGVGMVIAPLQYDNTTLTELDLTDNMLNADAAVRLAMSLSGNVTMRKLGLSQNKLATRHAGRALAMVLMENKIMSLDVSSNVHFGTADSAGTDH
jgi:Ran GTPase-activating protein (RanGAP) involved in mRNA processing and transport